MRIHNICICGGGNLGHVIAGLLASKKGNNVSVLTNKPHLWGEILQVKDVNGTGPDLNVKLNCISSEPQELIPGADVVLLCLPGFAIAQELHKVKPYLKSDAMVGSVFCSSGFFPDAFNILGKQIKLFGFQRVPFIARTIEYGHSAALLGYRSEHKIAVENFSSQEKEEFKAWVCSMFAAPARLLRNYLEATITNSNPLLHTSRLYTMFGDWREGITYPRNYLFYEEWTKEAAELYIEMDNELFQLLEVLPVSPNYLQRVLPYYESSDAVTLQHKLSSITGFKGITSPMKEIAEGVWIPDFQNRYFTEEFGYSLKLIWELTVKHGIHAPSIEKVFKWGRKMIGQEEKN